MKNFAILILMLSLTAGCFAESQFSVSGNGRVFYEPDAYDLSFAVVSDNADLQKCKGEHLAAVARVKEFLDGHKKTTLSLKQDVSRLETVYRPDMKEKLFRFTTAYTLRVNDAKSILSLQEGLISAGVTDITGLDMFSEKLPRLLEQARRDAIKDAKSKADLAASELGWSLTGASNISFGESEFSGQKASVAYGARSYQYDVSKRPETTTYVASQVSITFTFEKKK